jgi:hypothetical protein
MLRTVGPVRSKTSTRLGGKKSRSNQNAGAQAGEVATHQMPRSSTHRRRKNVVNGNGKKHTVYPREREREKERA